MISFRTMLDNLSAKDQGQVQIFLAKMKIKLYHGEILLLQKPYGQTPTDNPAIGLSTMIRSRLGFFTTIWQHLSYKPLFFLSASILPRIEPNYFRHRARIRTQCSANDLPRATNFWHPVENPQRMYGPKHRSSSNLLLKVPFQPDESSALFPNCVT